MARAYASTIIDAPIEAIWPVVRDFNNMPGWNSAVLDSLIEDDMDEDVVGCVRRFPLAGGAHVRERLLELDDSRYIFTYNFETPAFPIENYIATMELIPVTKTDSTFVHWRADFDEAPHESGKYVRHVSQDVFASGLKDLSQRVTGKAAPKGAQRWQGLRPAKVFTSSVIGAPRATVWDRMRNFSGMGGWHADITNMHMRDGQPPDKVSGVRNFRFGEGTLAEELTYLSDLEHAFRYRILESPMPWLNYHAGARLYAVTDTDSTFAVWTADWTASSQDDLDLIPTVHNDVFQKAFDTLQAQLGRS